jgi:hypothetical protein
MVVVIPHGFVPLDPISAVLCGVAFRPMEQTAFS